MTERVEDEAAKAIAQEIRQLIDTVNALIFGIDINGQINEWNQAAERITGYSKAEVMGHDLTDVFINQDYKASVKEALDRALTGEETANHEFPLYTKSGERVDVLLNLTALREAEGAIVGVVGVGQDIRGGHAEEQLVPASRLAALDEMAANVAHDLKQPLSVIRMAVENSLQKIRNGSAEPEYLLEKLERISAQTERAAEIIDHMRTFSRKTAEWASPVNPRDAVRGALDLMGEQQRLDVADAETELRTNYVGARLLLVEDNAINREMAVELLSGAGLAVESAENGRQAVERIRTTAYDLILMDIQMPQMDGLEATRVIRSMIGCADLPILAMTANVFEEDRQPCLEAGMNDFVAKPLDPKNLFSMIIKWLPKSAVSVETTPTSVLPAADPADAITLRAQLTAIEGMDAETGLRNMRGDVAGYLRLLRQIDTMHGEDMGKLGKHHAAGQIDEARRLAHTLKGAAGTLGLTELQAAARALEENLRSHDTRGNGDEVSHLMDAVSTEQNNLHEALTRITEQTVLENTLEADLVEAQKVLDHLVVLLEKDDTAANTLFLESEALLNSTFGPMAEQFGQQIEVFDYPAALNILDSLSTSSADTGSQVPVDVASSASEREDSPINPTGGG